MVLPKRWGSDPEVPPDGCFVPEHAVCDSITFRSVIQDQTLVVFGTRVHDLTKLVKGWKYTEKGFIEVLTILADVVPERKDIVHVGTDHRGHIHTVLGRHHKENLPVSTIHKELADGCVPHK